VNIGLLPELDEDDCVDEVDDVTLDDETGFRDPGFPDFLPPVV